MIGENVTTAEMEDKESAVKKRKRGKVKGGVISKDKGGESSAANKGNDGEVGEKGDNSGMIKRSNSQAKKVGGVDSRESLTGEDRPELSGTTKEVTKRNNTDHNLDRLINWQYLLPPIKLFYLLPI
jgi:hypothetical protein